MLLKSRWRSHESDYPRPLAGDSPILATSLPDLLWNYIYRTVYDGGYYKDICHGICRGCPLSPLIGTLYLKQLDDRMARTGLFYVRFMDDIVLMAPTRWKLRAAIKTVNQTLGELKLERHPEKTFIGRISRGFDFLGYAFTPARLGIAPKTFERFVERMTRLYEQGAGTVRIGEYARRWWRWVRAGLGVKIMGAVEINLMIGPFCSFDHEDPFHGRGPNVDIRKACTLQSNVFDPCTNARSKSCLVTINIPNFPISTGYCNVDL